MGNVHAKFYLHIQCFLGVTNKQTDRQTDLQLYYRYLDTASDDDDGGQTGLLQPSLSYELLSWLRFYVILIFLEERRKLTISDTPFIGQTDATKILNFLENLSNFSSFLMRCRRI